MIGRLLYNFALFLLLLVSLPKLFTKKYRRTLAARLGKELPDVSCEAKSKRVIWIHAISMGETRAVIPLFKKLRAAHPDAEIFISNTTETGLAEGKRSMPEATAHFLLPFDFSWTMHKLVKCIRADLLILVESDFWFNLLDQVKRGGGKVLLVNGKISARSAGRFRLVRFFSKALFSRVDHFCVQSESYKEQFFSLGIDRARITVTGNIKLDFAPQPLSAKERSQVCRELGIAASDRVIVAGSTHPGEEEMLLNAMKSVWEKIPEAKLLLVPRHPERFAAVRELLAASDISFTSYSEREAQSGRERIVLIDAMGLLNRCYQLAEAAVVCGSFVSGIGGHNIFEPTLVSVPVLFGPHMGAQRDLVELVLSGRAGVQAIPEQLANELLKLLDDKSYQQSMREAAEKLVVSIRGATERTFAAVEKQLAQTSENR